MKAFDHFSLALLYIPLFPFPFGGSLFYVATRNSYEKKRYHGKESEQTGRRKIGAKMMTDGMGILLMRWGMQGKW
jgi:hypothetical protein